MNYYKQTQILLDFQTLVEELGSYFISDYSRVLFKELVSNKPLSKKEIERQYQEIHEYHLLQSLGTDFSIHSVFDLNDVFNKLHIENFFIDTERLIQVRKMTQNVKEIKDLLGEINHQKELSHLVQLSKSIFYDSAILREIDKVIDEKGEVKTSASKLLSQIRERKLSVFSDAERAFQSALNSARTMGHLHDIGESIRNGRRVLAVVSAYKRSVKGIALDESESGNIIYIEPAETILLNNEISEIDREEQREIRRILIELTQFLSRYTKLLTQFQNHMVYWDSLQARTRFMMAIEGSIPSVGDTLSLRNAFHPLLKIKNKKEGKPIIPFHLEMSREDKLLMISGPNAGGKSVTLKTIGLLGLMVQYAIPISAHGESIIPLFSKILGDLGDLQSIDNELSTYSSKLALWKFMLQASDRNSLLLFDELGDGTDPSFGAAVAQVVLEEALEKKLWIVATTHYSDLKKFGEKRNDVLNANMMFDEKKLEPLYKLSIGLPGSSYTFHIAKKMGLNSNLIKRAEALSNSDKIQYDKQLFKIEKKERDLVQKKELLDAEERELKKQMKDWNRLHLDLDLMRKKMKYEKMMIQQEQILEKQKELQSFKEDLKNKRREEELRLEQLRIEEEKKKTESETKFLYKQIHQIDPNQEIYVGDRVQFIQTQAIGVVDKINKNKVTVIFDHIKSTISSDELIVIPEEEKKKAPIRRLVSVDKNSASRELDIRGKFVYEAIPEFEDFINKALVNSFHEIKVIHGKGKLKTEILKAIKGFKSISRYEHALPEHGGDGATIIYF